MCLHIEYLRRRPNHCPQIILTPLLKGHKQIWIQETQDQPTRM